MSLADNRMDCCERVEGRALETRDPGTKHLMSQRSCVRSGGGNGRAKDVTQYCLDCINSDQ